jgi:hypothetical protein
MRTRSVSLTALLLGCSSGDFVESRDEGLAKATSPIVLSCTGDAQCDDGTVCQLHRCSGGQCVHELKCNDHDICTNDYCDAWGQCSHSPTASCDDGNACNGLETCDPMLGCRPGTPPNCDDGDACTADRCDTVTGACAHGLPTDCSDDDPCTAEACRTPDAQCHRALTFCSSQPFQPGTWTEIVDYARRPGTAWGLFGLGNEHVVHFRTNDLASTPKAQMRGYTLQPDGHFEAGGWTDIPNYREAAGAGWGLIPLGNDQVLHFRTNDHDGVAQGKAQMRPYTLQPDGSFETGPWTEIAYYRESPGARWGLFALGGSVVHFRTNDHDGVAQGKAQMRRYTPRPDGRFDAGRWTTIADYRESPGARWGLFALGSQHLVHFRTDNEGATPEAEALLRRYSLQPDGSFVAESWTDISRYREGTEARWGLFALGDAQVIHFRTDNLGNELEHTGLFTAYTSQPNGAFQPAERNALEGALSQDTAGSNWGLFALGNRGVVHWRSDGETSAQLGQALFRLYTATSSVW